MDNIKRRAISIDELDRIELLEPQLSIIKKYRQKTIIEFYWILAVAIFMSSYFLYIMLTDYINFSDNIWISAIVILMVLCIFWSIKSIISAHRNLYYKAQYGVIERKFTVTRRDGNNRKKVYYYFNVIFPEKETFIDNVFCSKDFYLKSIEGDEVVVISFHKNDLQAIPVVR